MSPALGIIGKLKNVQVFTTLSCNKKLFDRLTCNQKLIDTFIQMFYKEVVIPLSDEEVNKVWKNKCKQAGEEMSLKFNSQDVRDFYKIYLLPGSCSKMRKLSIQVSETKIILQKKISKNNISILLVDCWWKRH